VQQQADSVADSIAMLRGMLLAASSQLIRASDAVSHQMRYMSHRQHHQ